MNIKNESLGRRSFTIAAVIVAATFITSLLFYSQLPESIITHWNAQGVGDGHGPRITVFLIPIISLGLIALFYFIPKIEPTKNIYEFKSQYTGFMNVILLFMLFLNGITIAVNMGIKLNLNRFLALALGFQFYLGGVYIEHAKQNWFFGIRTWWTLSNEIVWDRTHKIGSKLFKACGIIALAGVLIPQYAIILILVPVIGVAIYLIYYSQKEYNKIIQDVTL
ncbi:SdpI family protein [Thermoproteota archaeon]